MHSPAIHEASGIRYQVSGIRHPASGIRHPASGIRHPASGIRHQASGIRHQASGIKHQFPSSDVSHFPPWVAAGERTFQPIFSGSAIGFLRHVAQRHDGLRSRHHGSVCALPLLTGKHAIGRVRSSRFARKLPAPAIPRTPPIMLLLPESPLPRCPGLHRTDHLLPGVEGMFAGIERDPARSKPRTAVRPQATSVPITPRSPKRIAVSRETTHETGHKMRARDL